MSWSYSGNPKGSNIDLVRFLIGDTKASMPLLQDEEIDYNLETIKSPYLAAAACCESIAAAYARECDKTIGPTSIKANTLMEKYLKLAEHLKKENRRKTIRVPVMTQPHEAIFDVGLHDNV